MYVMNFKKEEPEVLLKNLILISWLVRKRRKGKSGRRKERSRLKVFSLFVCEVFIKRIRGTVT